MSKPHEYEYEYDVIAYMTITVHTRVCANSASEARVRAANRHPVDLCLHCGGDDELAEAWCPAGGLDGEPRIERVEEVKKR